MGDITTSDFERVPETIPLGEAAARAMAEQLSAYSLPAAEYTAWRQEVNVTKEDERHVSSISVEGLNWVNEDYLRSVSKIRTGDTVSIDAISRDARSMAALDDLESVAYRLEGDVGSTALIWMPSEASIGKDYVSPSLGIYGDGGGDLKFQLGIQHVRRWMNERGGQWRNELKLGYDSAISSSFYQPLDVRQAYFVEPKLLFNRSTEIFTSTAITSRRCASRISAGASTSAGTWHMRRRFALATGAVTGRLQFKRPPTSRERMASILASRSCPVRHPRHL